MKSQLRVSGLFMLIIIALATSIAGPAPTQAQAYVPYYCTQREITVYQDINFGGTEMRIGPGINWPYMVSGWNDVISSICVPAGAYFKVWRNSDYSWLGGSLTIDNRGNSQPVLYTDLRNNSFNDTISSFKSSW